MRSENHKQLDGLLALLSPAVPNNTDPVQKEPLTYHRRGHWFNSSIAHHVNGLHNDELPLRELLKVLLGSEGRRRLMLRQMNNEDLFQLYDSDLVLRLHNAKNLGDTRKILTRFRQYLGNYPPSPELAKSYLAPYTNRKPRTLYRYAQMLRMFMKWYGEPMDDLKVKIPKTLPPYTEDSEITRLFNAIENKKTHKGCIMRDSLLAALALKTGIRRSELGNLEVKDIHQDFLMVRSGKGGKDRIIPLAPAIAERLQNFIKGKEPEEKVFSLKPACISNKIRQFARKAGLNDFHTQTMRHKFTTDLLERGANIKQVQELLGHENLATTEVYLSITNQGLRDAVNLFDKQPSRQSELGKKEKAKKDAEWAAEQEKRWKKTLKLIKQI